MHKNLFKVHKTEGTTNRLLLIDYALICLTCSNCTTHLIIFYMSPCDNVDFRFVSSLEEALIMYLFYVKSTNHYYERLDFF